MADAVDVYHEWLGIPAAEQPPHHYRLLGIEPFESSPRVIEHAASRQASYIATFQSGSQSGQAQVLLNQIAVARACLLDPIAKAQYDDGLRAHVAPAGGGAFRWLIPTLIGSGALVCVLLGVLAAVLWTGDAGARRDQRLLRDVQVADATPEGAVVQPPVPAAPVLEQNPVAPAAPPTAPPARSEAPTEPVAAGGSSVPASSVSNPAGPAAGSGSPPAMAGAPQSPNVPAAPTAAAQAPAGPMPGPLPAAGAPPPQPAPPPEPPPPDGGRVTPRTKPSEPDRNAQEAARDTLLPGGREQLKKNLAPADKHERAESFLRRAQDEQDDSRRFVLLDEARTLAADSGDLRLPITALAEMERSFRVDTLPRKVDVVKRLTSSVKTDADRRVLAGLALDLGKQASRVEQFDAAKSMLEMGQNFARKLHDNELTRRFREQTEQLAGRTARRQAADQAEQRLATAPDDADAHLTRGKYLCFVRADWDEGLPHLARGRDGVLVALANQELQGPTEAVDLLTLADAWFDWGRGATGDDRSGAWSRSRAQYQAVRARVSDEQRQHVEDRLRELAAFFGDTPPLPLVMRLPWLDGPTGEVRTFEGHQADITALAVSGGGTLLASAAQDRSVRLWDLQTGNQNWWRATETGNLNGVAFTPDERVVVANFDNQQMRLWTVADGKASANIPTSGRSPTALTVTPQGQSLVWATRSRPPNLFVWSLDNNQPGAPLGEGEFPSVLDVTPDGRVLVTGDARGVLRVWDPGTGALTRVLAVHSDAVTDIDLSPDGALVASATFDQVRVTDLASGQIVHAFDVPAVRTVAFSPDGRRLVSGGAREEVYVWDVRTGRRVDTLRAEAAFSSAVIRRLAFLPDPRGLVTGATDGVIRLWRLPD